MFTSSLKHASKESVGVLFTSLFDFINKYSKKTNSAAAVDIAIGLLNLCIKHKKGQYVSNQKELAKVVLCHYLVETGKTSLGIFTLRLTEYFCYILQYFSMAFCIASSLDTGGKLNVYKTGCLRQQSNVDFFLV